MTPEAPEPAGYVHVARRVDGDWGVTVRGDNHQGVWHNHEGWQELSYVLEQARRWFPSLTIRVTTDPDGAETVIEPGDDLP